jgi:acid phosphatase type 7
MRGIVRPWFFGILAVGLLSSVTTAVSYAQAPPFLIGKEEVWKYSAGGSHPPEAWKQASFDDAAWKSGRAGFGYGDSDDATVLENMRNRYTAVYIRKSFHVERLDGLDSLYLYVKYDDAFIAYLNGKQIASGALKQTTDGPIVELHEAQTYEAFVIRDAKSLLRPGKNVLAIEGHNVSADSSDFSLDPFLATRKVGVFTVAD